MHKIKVLEYCTSENPTCVSCETLKSCGKSLSEVKETFVCDKYERSFIINDYDINQEQLQAIKDILTCQK